MLALKLHPEDNVAIALADIPAGSRLTDISVVAEDVIPAGHKIAVRLLDGGAPIKKYGQVIGFATTVIRPGQHVHIHNVVAKPFARENPVHRRKVSSDSAVAEATFLGIARDDGRVATRNYIGILTSVNCSATVARAVARHFEDRLDRYPNIDGVVAFTHTTGCAMSAEGDAINVLRRTISGYLRHPNFHSALLVGLGCEVNQTDDLAAQYAGVSGKSLHAFDIQKKGGTRSAITHGIEIIEGALEAANAVRRQPLPASCLKVGLQCGGSDGYSGISANPALGAAMDLLVRHGGTAILSETPEIYGAEHLLAGRAVSSKVADRLMQRIQWWEEYTSRNGSEMNNNPSPGNKQGGLTTIFEKSLGAVAKGGTSELCAVYEYAEEVREKGLVFMDTPGYDPVSATGQVAGGANMICFTTGRGSAYGCKPVPVLKLATNSVLYARQADDLDLNCGTILSGEESVEDVGRRIFDLILQTASGAKSKSEQWGYGEDEFAPWVLGATM